MRFSNTFWNVSPALLATAALIMVTGVAGAIFDSSDSITPDSPKYDGSAGYVVAAGPGNSTGVWFTCVDATNDFHGMKLNRGTGKPASPPPNSLLLQFVILAERRKAVAAASPRIDHYLRIGLTPALPLRFAPLLTFFHDSSISPTPGT